MVSTVWQLIEKANEHKMKTFMCLLISEMHGSVTREPLWLALSKLGVPDTLTKLILPFYQGMKATTDTLLEESSVETGLRQGCCMSPALFNIYASLVAKRWSAEVKNAEGVGLHLYHKPDGKVFLKYLDVCT